MTPASKNPKPPNNLPTREVSLEGRTLQLDEIENQLERFTLVTIAGTGGVGKTSLAVHFAQRHLHDFPGGVWFCDFASITDSATLATAVAGTVAGNAGAFSGFDKLISRLSGERKLLVLDNCEHVVDEAADLVEKICDRVSNLNILATSREPLGLAEECIYRLEGLNVEGESSDAAELFIHRASTSVDIDLTPVNTKFIQDIVRRLEGLPLAIELAASRLTTMSLEELHEALEDQLATLQSRRRRSRQATLHQAIAWSFDLLTEQEKTTLRILAVFRAPFTIEAALEVCNLGRSGRLVIERLVEKSVLARQEIYGRSRFRLLEPIRQFSKQLGPMPQHDDALRRHAEFFAARAEELGSGINGENELKCSDDLNREWPDLREAVAWGRTHSKFEIAVMPIVQMARNIMFHLRTEAYGWLIEAEKQFPTEFATRDDVLWVLANGYWIMADPERCEEILDQADAIQVTPQNLWVRYFLRFSQNRFEESIAAAEQAEKLANESTDEIEKRWWSNAFKVCPMAMANPSDTRIDPSLAASRAQVDQLDWPTGKAFFGLAEGTVLINRGQLDDAKEKYDEITMIARECGNLWIELISRLVFNEAANPNLPADVKLQRAVSGLKSLIDHGEEAHYPIAV
ncbi:MAG: NB-ARC domain-containing protein, partial [Planctomycetota bacterium]